MLQLLMRHQLVLHLLNIALIKTDWTMSGFHVGWLYLICFHPFLTSVCFIYMPFWRWAYLVKSAGTADHWAGGEAKHTSRRRDRGAVNTERVENVRSRGMSLRTCQRTLKSHIAMYQIIACRTHLAAWGSASTCCHSFMVTIMWCHRVLEKAVQRPASHRLHGRLCTIWINVFGNNFMSLNLGEEPVNG